MAQIRMSSRRRVRQVHAAAAAAGALLAGTAGCNKGGLADIDARTQRLLDERSAMVGGGAAAPARAMPPAEGPLDRSITAKTIPTVNPGPEDLRYRPAQESRDVAARLEAYANRSEAPPGAPPVVTLDLTSAMRIAQRSASEYLSAEEEYILSAIRLLIERHLWGPRLFNDTSVTVSGVGDEGDFRSALRVVNDLRVTQRLPYGGQVEAAWVWAATEQLREQAGGRYTQSSELVLSGAVPLLRGAGLVAQENLIQAERDLVYAARDFEEFRRDFLVEIARDYFDLLLAKAQILNQENQVAALRRIERGEIARFEAGRIAEFQKNIASNDVLQAIERLAGSREVYILALERFRIRLGIPPDQPIELDESVIQIPEPEVSLEEATANALSYRLDLQNRRDQLDDFRRAVKNARNDLLPDLDLTARVGIPTDPGAREGGVLIQPDFLDYQAGITFGLPLDREIERLSLRQASIALQRREREYLRFRDEVAVGVRQAVRNIDVARFQLNLAEQRVEINKRRLRELELKAADVDTQTQVDAANNLQASEAARDRALADLRTAVLTYLRDAGLLRVARDGSFQTLPGMEASRPPVPPLPPPPGAAPGPAGPAGGPPGE